ESDPSALAPTTSRRTRPIATVFPEPVCELMRRSLSRNAGSSTCCCTRVSDENPRAAMARISAGPRTWSRADVSQAEAGRGAERDRSDIEGGDLYQSHRHAHARARKTAPFP